MRTKPTAVSRISMVEPQKFSQAIQSKINWFAFFLAFPALDILGLSATFYIFLSLIYSCGFFWERKYKGKYLFLGFLLIGTLGTFLTPIPEVFQSLQFLMSLIQFYYWIGVAVFFIVFFQRIDLIQLSKWVLIGLLVYSLAFYLIGFNFESFLISITCTPGRNAYVFVVLACMPMTFFYLKEKSRTTRLFFYLFFILMMLLSNGRSGAVIILIEVLLVSLALSPALNKGFKWLIPLLLLVFVVTQTDEFEVYKYELSNTVEPLSPRFASLIAGEGEGDLEKDKSWLIRKLMIDKGKEIVEEHPFLGVGPMNFTKYKAELNVFTSDKYSRLQSVSLSHLQQRTSAHNTYLQVITEFGILGSFFFFLILLSPIWEFGKLFWLNRLRTEHVFLISLIGISIHFYAIASLTGALPWFVIGLAWGSTYLNTKKNFSK
ncbi:MAG: O-antigen ligase family protein [Crocinitomicaceae bacterium]|nr:O-antigen ligase family protein [Crocinitomicaceae bacterium]